MPDLDRTSSGATSRATGGIFLGCAGWSIPRVLAGRFPPAGSHLERYAAVLGAVEIDSSFYRPHRRTTYERWAASVPAGFRFAVKLPRSITHERRLRDAGDLLDPFLADVAGLGPRLGCLLVQLPPSLEYRRERLDAFLDALQARHAGAVALEPRHPSWFEGAACVQLAARRVARVAADPAPGRGGERPGGDRGVSYFRLHGSPRMYYSDYDLATLAAIAAQLERARQVSPTTWCIFDNTALGAAPRDALAVRDLLGNAPEAGRFEAAGPGASAGHLATVGDAPAPRLNRGRPGAPATGTRS